MNDELRRINDEVNYKIVGFLAWLKGVLEGSNYQLDQDQLKEVATRINELNLAGMPRSLVDRKQVDEIAAGKRAAWPASDSGPCSGSACG